MRPIIIAPKTILFGINFAIVCSDLLPKSISFLAATPFKIKPPKKGQMTPQPIAVLKKLNAKSLLKRALALVKVKKQMIPLIIAVAMPQQCRSS